jgi:hypothetical protein
MKAFIIDIRDVIMAQAAIDGFQVLVMREIIHPIQIDMTADAIQIGMDRSGKEFRIDMQRYFPVFPLGSQLRVIMTC